MSDITTPAERAAIRALLAARKPPSPRHDFRHSATSDSDPVDDFASKIIYDVNDPDSCMMRQATVEGARLRGFAQRAKIDLHVPRKIDPALLGGHAETLTGIFNRHSPSPAYRAWEDDRTFELAHHLCTQIQFKDMLRHWSSYTDTQRVFAIDWLSRVQQAIFAENLMRPAVTCIRTFSMPRTAPPDSTIIIGRHRSPDIGRRSHDVEINLHPDAAFQNLSNALEVTFHENLHVSQYALALNAASGVIGPDHPLHREARIFAMSYGRRDSYLSSVDIVYRAHPLEADTFPQSARYHQMLTSALQDNNLPALPAPRSVKAPAP